MPKSLGPQPRRPGNSTVSGGNTPDTTSRAPDKHNVNSPPPTHRPMPPYTRGTGKGSKG